jgi:hypothetical protein
LSRPHISTSAGEGRHTYLREGGFDSGFENADAEQDIGILSTGSDESAHASIFSQILDEIIFCCISGILHFQLCARYGKRAGDPGDFGHPKWLAREFRLLSARNPADEDKRRNQDEV